MSCELDSFEPGRWIDIFAGPVTLTDREKLQAAHLEKLLRRIPGVSVTRQAICKRRPGDQATWAQCAFQLQVTSHWSPSDVLRFRDAGRRAICCLARR